MWKRPSTKSSIRPVQAHVEQGPVFPDLILQGCGQLLQNIRAEAAVRMQDSDIASLVQLRQTVESVVQFVQGAASGTQSAS